MGPVAVDSARKQARYVGRDGLGSTDPQGLALSSRACLVHWREVGEADLVKSGMSDVPSPHRHYHPAELDRSGVCWRGDGRVSTTVDQLESRVSGLWLAGKGRHANRLSGAG